MEWDQDLFSGPYRENLDRSPRLSEREHRRRERELTEVLTAPPTGGVYHGLGPRGYRRPDERILEEVFDALTYQDVLDASDIEVTVKDGVVTFQGMVSSRREKRAAEELAERVRGVVDIDNKLRVRTAEQVAAHYREREEALIQQGRHGSGWSPATHH
ncbi:MAG: BON domain-containing protein [Myxococcota bacterium]